MEIESTRIIASGTPEGQGSQGAAFGFVLVIERGELEAMAVLLVESLRRQPSLRETPIFVVQPRSGGPPSDDTLRRLTENQAWYLRADLNKAWRHHALMNKVYATAWVESLVESSLDTLVYLDTDLILASAPDLERIRLGGVQVVGAAPVADWRLGEIGQVVGEPLSDYWKMIYSACEVEALPDWSLTTVIDGCTMLPYFNSGMIAVRPRQALFRCWRENVERLARDHRSQGFATGSQEFYFLEQASFAGTVLAKLSREQIRVLDHRYNYPLHLHHLFPEPVRARALDEICFVHYHGHFSNLYWLDDIAVSEPLRTWLLDRLPLRPRLRLNRRSAAWYLSHLMSRFPLRPYHHRIVSRIPSLCRTVPYPPGQ